ncbi:hypothetical protein PHMEG_00010137 [Phytophthora megakarya]|uniref:Uncharacterized protein n=1 Tax=Phytophthora megakarya TaxID=4795 RepID=A0A225WEF9_9STRA|nr:hypothetical protein PHMEG_00010137 [Phytophthora megakarya]
MSEVFASIVWGHTWACESDHQEMHVHMHVDNTAAVACNNRHAARNPHAQMLLQILSLQEVCHNFYVTADHIPGVENVMADAGSYHPAEIAETLAGLGAVLREGSLAESSQKAYSRSWRQWVSWCTFMRYTPWLPRGATAESTAQLGGFAVFLWKFGMNRRQVGNSYGTICSKLCAVRWHHRYELRYDPGVNEQHVLLLRGIRRFTSPVAKQQRLTPSLLRRIYSLLDTVQTHHQLLRGGLVIVYFFILLRSDYLFIGKKYLPFALRLGDIQFCDENGRPARPRCAKIVGILLRGSKNSQFGKKEFRLQHISEDTVLCPVRAAHWIRQRRKKEPVQINLR